jgi:hypothetical protein
MEQWSNDGGRLRLTVESERPTGAGNLITAKRLEHTGYMGRLAIRYCGRRGPLPSRVWHTHNSNLVSISLNAIIAMSPRDVTHDGSSHDRCSPARTPTCLARHPPTIFPLSVARGLPAHFPSRVVLGARVHRPSTRGSHERKLLRSRLRVVLGTLYRNSRTKEESHQGRRSVDERQWTLGHGKKVEGWRSECGSGMMIFFDRMKADQGKTGIKAGSGVEWAGRFQALLQPLNPATEHISLG